MNRFLLLSALFFALVQCAMAQAPTKVWDKTIGGSLNDYGNVIVNTSDGGIIISGYSESNASGDKSENSRGGNDYWIVKLNSSGQKVWDKTIGGSGSDEATALVVTSDGGIIIAGYSNSNASGDKSENSRGDNDYWIVKLNSSGQKIWDKTIGGDRRDYASAIAITSDGEVVITGNSDSNASGDKSESVRALNFLKPDYWIVKLNSSGQKMWDRTLGGWGWDDARAITVTSDGEIVVAGYSDSQAFSSNGDKSENSLGSDDYWIVKLNSSGQKIWDKTIGGSGLDRASSITAIGDGGLLIVGASSSSSSNDKSEISRGGTDYWIVKLNNGGQKVWDKTIGGDADDEATAISVTNDGGIIIAGFTASNASGDKSEDSRGFTDYWVVKLGGINPNCPSCIMGQTAANFSSNDHFCAAQYLCSQNIILANQTQNPITTKIERGDLAKISYLSLLDNSVVTQAEHFPVPFVDLQNVYATNTTYYKYAKVLSYLTYQDGRSPFDRNQLNFNPADSITRALVLKVFLESWNIDETAATGTSPFTDVPASHPYFKYIKKAHELGLVTGSGGLFRPNVACTREDAFLILTRLLTSSSATKPTLTQINAGFFVPGQYRPDNLAVGVGTDRGNFNHYTKTSFALDGVVPLVFAHSYNSYTTELPDQLFPNYLGRGWSHSFNCYVTAVGSGGNARLVVHYPDGKLHFFKPSGGVFVPESVGVFDAVTTAATSGTLITQVTVTTPAKIEYVFEKMTGQKNDYWLVKTIKDRNNNTLTFTNELGIADQVRLKSVSDPVGRTLNFVYNASRNWLAEVNLSGVGTFNGRKITFDYHPLVLDGDSIPDLAAYKEPDLTGALKTTSYGYFPYADSTAHLLKTITLPKGNVVNNTYQQRKLRSSQTLNGAAVVQQMSTSWTDKYVANSQGSVGTVAVTAGAVTKATSYTHNTNGLTTNLKSSGTNPVDLSMDYGLSPDPTSVTRITQNAGQSSSTSVRIKYHNTPPYNVEFVKTAKAVGDSITQSYAYNTLSDVTSFTNGRGFTTSFAYNTTGNLTQINHPFGQPTQMLRNGNGTISRVTTPANVVTNFTYNEHGNLLTTSTPNGANPAITTSATYDVLSRVLSKTDARNQSVTYEYFANDLLKRMNAPLSYSVGYNYDANDNNTTVTNAKGNATTNVYHPQTDQLVSRSFGAKTESFTYYEDGSLKTYTNGRGNLFTFTYDPSGRLTDDSYSTYGFNNDGTLNTVTHAQGAKTYVLDYDYDLLKRLSQTTCDGFPVQYRYDNNNNLDRLTYPDNKTVTYGYDQKDRLTTVTDWAGRVTTFVYDNDGKLLNYTLPNTSKAIYSYDAAGRPTGISHQKANNTPICSYTFTLDQGGNHTEENAIEPLGPIPGITPGTIHYATDARNQTTQVGTAFNSSLYAFDGNGAINNQAGQTITWDSKDNLLTRNGKTYFYDGNETRRAKTGRRYVINELSNSVIAETDDNGTYLYYYVYGPSGLLYRQNASTEAVEYYHYDFRGSTIAMTDAGQNIVRQYQYDAYGKILQQTPTAATDDNPFRYVGQHGVQYEDASLYFMRARYYDPTTGKFLSEDPIWSTNLYAYGDNNPVNMIDPSGLYSLGDFLTQQYGNGEWDGRFSAEEKEEYLQSFIVSFVNKILESHKTPTAYTESIVTAYSELIDYGPSGGLKFKKDVTSEAIVKIINSITLDTENLLGEMLLTTVVGDTAAEKIMGSLSPLVNGVHLCTVEGWGYIFDLIYQNKIVSGQCLINRF